MSSSFTFHQCEGMSGKVWRMRFRRNFCIHLCQFSRRSMNSAAKISIHNNVESGLPLRLKMYTLSNINGHIKLIIYVHSDQLRIVYCTVSYRYITLILCTGIDVKCYFSKNLNHVNLNKAMEFKLKILFWKSS